MTTTVFSSSATSGGLGPVFIYKASGDGLVVNPGVTLTSGFLTVSARSGLTDLEATINGTLAATMGIKAVGSSMHLEVGSTGRMGSFNASFDSSVDNHGFIRGLHVIGTTDSSVENWGTVSGSGVGFSNFYGDDSIGHATFINHGTVDSWRYGIVARNTDADIVNDGTISAKWWGIATDGDNATATIGNTGVIDSRAYGILATNPVQLTNDGTISGKRGSLYFLLAADDTVTNNGHLDGRAQLGGGNDIYHGENGQITGAVWGQAGDDLLVGGAFADIFSGGSGSDTLTGGAGADKLAGAAGADLLSGGTGDDIFHFATAGESAGDKIVASGGAAAFEGVGTAGGDRIDVSAIDANQSLAGMQHFVFGTSHGIGHLWAEDVGNVTHIRGNVAGGAAPEFDVAIDDGAGVHAADYAGVDFIL